MSEDILSGKTAKELGTTYAIVRHILKTKPDTRNSDTILLAYVQKFCKDNNMAPISPATIFRSRRKVQNQEKLYRASEDVQERRAQKAEEFRGHYSRKE